MRLMWLIKNRIKVNWPLFFYNMMMSYKLDNSKKLPYPSFLGCVLIDNDVRTEDTRLTKPNPRSGLDKAAVNKLHYYQDSRDKWFNNNGDVWYYDDIVVPARTYVEMEEEMRANMNIEEAGLEGDVEMEDVEDNSDSDYDPNNVEVHQGGD